MSQGMDLGERLAHTFTGEVLLVLRDRLREQDSVLVGELRAAFPDHRSDELDQALGELGECGAIVDGKPSAQLEFTEIGPKLAQEVYAVKKRDEASRHAARTKAEKDEHTALKAAITEQVGAELAYCRWRRIWLAIDREREALRIPPETFSVKLGQDRKSHPRRMEKVRSEQGELGPREPIAVVIKSLVVLTSEARTKGGVSDATITQATLVPLPEENNFIGLKAALECTRRIKQGEVAELELHETVCFWCLTTENWASATDEQREVLTEYANRTAAEIMDNLGENEPPCLTSAELDVIHSAWSDAWTECFEVVADWLITEPN